MCPSVFPDSWLFEPLEGGDVLLLGALGEPDLNAVPIAPLLGPDALRRVAAGAPLNTDDRNRVELNAPRSLHLATVEANRALLLEALEP